MSLSDYLFGRRLATYEEGEQRVGVLAGIPMLGLDALGSAAYGPEAALTLLIPLGAAGISYVGPISTLIIILLMVVYFSYRQTIGAYPHGGGSYTVARENLGTIAGLFAASALLLDYVLVVAVGISAGVGALVSAIPVLQPHTLALCLVILALITLVNLRGVRESGGAFMAPTYLFIVSLLGVLAVGVFKTVMAGGHPTPQQSRCLPPASASTAVSLGILMRAFASGCTAMTGVEAVSNGGAAFREPAVDHARRTLTAIIGLLGVMLAGIAYLCRAYGIGATEPGAAGYESILSQLTAAVIGRGFFYYVTIGSVLSVLALSANTGFADFPRLCRVIASDGFLPSGFAHRGRRLVYSQGILVLAVLSGGLLIAFDGITDHLIPLFAVGAFLAFTLSQAGMVEHWRRVGGEHAGKSMVINAAGAVCTAVTLVIVMVSKFAEGAWVVMLLVPLNVVMFYIVRAHYQKVGREVATDLPLNVDGLEPPVVLLPVRGWSAITRKALRFALKISTEIYARLHIAGRRANDGGTRGQLAATRQETHVRGPPACAQVDRLLFALPPTLFALDRNHLRSAKVPPGSRHRGHHPRVDRYQVVPLHPAQPDSRHHGGLSSSGAGSGKVVVINVPWYLSS